MFHFEGGWPKEINPKDEETTVRFRRRVEKGDDWEPKLRNLFKVYVTQRIIVNFYVTNFGIDFKNIEKITFRLILVILT